MKTIFLVMALVAVAFAATLPRQERSVSSEGGKHDNNQDGDKKKDVNICESRTPCGWAVYKRFTRQIDFFMKNSCECPSKTKCARDDDDISVSAFVYRCHPEEKEDQHSVTGEQSSTPSQQS